MPPRRRKRTRTRNVLDSDSEDFLSSSSDEEPQNKQPHLEESKETTSKTQMKSDSSLSDDNHNSESDNDTDSSSDWNDSSDDEEEKTKKTNKWQQQPEKATVTSGRINTESMIPKRTPPGSPEQTVYRLPTAALLDPANQLFKPLPSGPILEDYKLQDDESLNKENDTYGTWWRDRFANEFEKNLDLLYKQLDPTQMDGLLESIQTFSRLRTDNIASHTVWKHDVNTSLDPLNSLDLHDVQQSWASVPVGGASDVDILLQSLANGDSGSKMDSEMSDVSMNDQDAE